MAWKNYYLPPNSKNWYGRLDSPHASSLFQIIKMLDLSQTFSNKQPLDISFAFLGFQCDEGIRRNFGRIGATKGPDAIREAIAKLPIHQSNTLFYDTGNIICNNENLEATQEALAETVAMLLKNHLTPILLGGGHEIAWGHYQGIVKAFPKTPLHIVNFDAHFDMRPLTDATKGNSGTPFLQIALAQQKNKQPFHYCCIGIQRASNTQSLFNIASEYHTEIILADDLHQNNAKKCKKILDKLIRESKAIYLSLCLDVFAAPFAPGVSAPQPLGIIPWQLIPLLRKLAASGKIISYDIAELSPQYDIDQRTAKLAANLIFNIIHYHQKMDIQ